MTSDIYEVRARDALESVAQEESLFWLQPKINYLPLTQEERIEIWTDGIQDPNKWGNVKWVAGVSVFIDRDHPILLNGRPWFSQYPHPRVPSEMYLPTAYLLI